MPSSINTSLSELSIATSCQTAHDVGNNKRCPKCNLLFETRRDLMIHQVSVGHFLCDDCGHLFSDPQDLVDHKQTKHRPDQSIVCPGCQKTFARAGTWMRHVEESQCTGIFLSTLEARREERLKFAQALKNLNPADNEKLYFRPQSVTKDDDATTRFVFDNHRPHADPDANKLYFRPDDFPATEKQKFRAGDSKEPDFLTGNDPNSLEQKPGNAWAQKKNLFPQSYNAVPPPPELIENLRKPGPGASSLHPTGQRITDPDHPNFNASVFKDPILDTFKCPYLLCKVKPKSAQGLVKHLRSPAHSEVDIACPSCKKIFKTMTAWVEHTELSVKCNIRNSDDYRPALGQLTGGILDVHPRKVLKNNTPLFGVDKKFVEEMGYNKPAPIPGIETIEAKRKAEEAEKQGNSRRGGRKNR